MPSLEPGTYRVVISLENFKTLSYDNVVIGAGQPVQFRSTLEVGGLEEISIIVDRGVAASADFNLATQYASDRFQLLPLKHRSLLDALTLLPGFDTDASGTLLSRYTFGRPSSTLGIFVEGADVSLLGPFSIVPVTLDWSHEMDVAGRVPGLDPLAARPQVIQFFARSGSNQLDGTGYGYLRPLGEIPSSRFGAAGGGAIVMPGVWDGHGRAFFFANWEGSRTHRDQDLARQTVVAFRTDLNATRNQRLTLWLDLGRDNVDLGGTSASSHGLVASAKLESTITSNIVSELRLDTSSSHQEGRAWSRRVSETVSYLRGRHSIVGGVTLTSERGASFVEPKAAVFLLEQWHARDNVTLDGGVRSDRVSAHVGWYPNVQARWLRHLIGEPWMSGVQASYSRIFRLTPATVTSVDLQRSLSWFAKLTTRFTRVSTTTTDYRQTELTFEKPVVFTTIRVSYAYQASRGLEGISHHTLKLFGCGELFSRKWLESHRTLDYWLSGWNLAIVGRIENHRSADVALHKIVGFGRRQSLDFALEAYDVFNTLGHTLKTFLITPSDFLALGDVTHAFDRPGRTYQFVARVKW